jgi:hypothetical protein
MSITALSTSFALFPPHMQIDTTSTSGENENIKALSLMLDYVDSLTSVGTTTPTHRPLSIEEKRLLFFNLNSIFDDSVSADQTDHIQILNEILISENIPGRTYASTQAGYSAAEVIEILKNLWANYFNLQRLTGRRWPVKKILEIFLFTGITLQKEASPNPKWDGSFYFDGLITFDGNYYNDEFTFEVIATKPVGLTVAQAKTVATNIVNAYIPAWAKVTNFTIS